jgi:sulfonate transport system ATP-binding protein
VAWFAAKNLSKSYLLGSPAEGANGDGLSVLALDSVSLSAERGDFIAIVGRSGSGKTTFLRLVAGLTEKSGGEIVYDDGAQPPPRIGVVFQEPRLMPWLTVEGNILFAFLQDRNFERHRKRARELLRMLGLTDCADAYPDQLSGGMAQRVALGRALCYEPELILMDEPLGALDYFTRRSLQEEILKFCLTPGKTGKTIFFVTHDVEEALILSRRIVVLERGRLVSEIQVDLPYPRKRTSPEFTALLEKVLSVI